MPVRHLSVAPHFFDVGTDERIDACSRFVHFQRRGSALRCRFVRLGIDAHRVQTTVTQQGGCGWYIHSLDQSARRVAWEPVRMDVGYIGTTAERSQQIADTAFSTEDGPLGRFGPNCVQSVGVFSGTLRALSPFPFRIAGFPERGCPQCNCDASECDLGHSQARLADGSMRGQGEQT
jgi:hypothetical protein